MADNPKQYGLRWQRSVTGNSSTPPIVRKRVASAYQAQAGGNNVHLWPGDPVKLVNDGTVALATAGDAIYGVVAAVAPYFDGTAMKFGKYLPGGTTYGAVLSRESVVHVIPALGQVFEIDCDDASTATTQATYTSYIEENADISLNYDSSNLSAAPRLDISTHASTAAQLRIIDISPRTDIDFTGNYVKLLVMVSESNQVPYLVAGV